MSDLTHPTVASTTEFDAARQTMAMLNAKDLAITGRIGEVEVHERESRSLANETRVLCTDQLRGHISVAFGAGRG